MMFSQQVPAVAVKLTPADAVKPATAASERNKIACQTTAEFEKYLQEHSQGVCRHPIAVEKHSDENDAVRHTHRRKACTDAHLYTAVQQVNVFRKDL